LSNSSTGIPHKVHLVNADFDNCVTGVQVNSPGAPGNLASIQMTNVTIQASTGAGAPAGNGIWIEEGSAFTLIQASGLRVSHSGKSAIQIDAGNVNFYGENVSIENWAGSFGFSISSTSSFAWLGVGFAFTSGGTPIHPTAQFHLAQHT
jgi:hypothetical protein